MSYKIESYTFLKGLDTLKSSDFHTTKNIQGTSIQIFNLRTSYIKGSLKFLKDPAAILFYYNNTDNVFLKKWAETNSINTNGAYTNNVKYYHVNLDYETELKNTFENIEESNPFFWTKIPIQNNKPFVLFYLDTYPQFTYNGTFNPYLITEYFDKYKEKVDNSDLFRNKLIRKEVFENKTGYYLSLVDQDFSTIPGVSIFLQDYLGSTKIQLQKYGTSYGNIYEFNKTKVGTNYSIDLLSINNKNDIITLTNLNSEQMGYFKEIDLDKKKIEKSKEFNYINDNLAIKSQNNSVVIDQKYLSSDIAKELEDYLKK